MIMPVNEIENEIYLRELPFKLLSIQTSIMKYQYLFQYKDLANGSIKRMSSFDESKLTLDDLFLRSFINYVERTSGFVSYEGEEHYPRKISELRGDSAILFAQMEFKILSGQENLLKSPGFGRRTS